MKKILIVEDDTLLNRTLGYNLTSDGYAVTSAYNYKDAVQHLKDKEFDISLLLRSWTSICLMVMDLTFVKKSVDAVNILISFS